MFLGGKRASARRLLPVGVALSLGWLLFNWNSLSDKSAAVDGMRVVLQEHMDRYEALHAGVQGLPEWGGDSAEAAEEIGELMEMAAEDGITSSNLSVDQALICHVFSEAFPDKSWGEKAEQHLFDVADPSESGYHAPVAALVRGTELAEGDENNLRYMLEGWPDDWWIVALAERFGMKPYGPRKAMLERGRAGAWKTMAVVLIDVLVYAVALAALWFVWRRLRRPPEVARYSERLFSLVSVPVMLTGYGVVMWILSIFATVFVILAYAQFTEEEARWIWVGATIAVVLMQPVCMRVAVGFRKGSTAGALGLRFGDLYEWRNWLLVVGFACITLSVITLINLSLGLLGVGHGLADVLPDGFDYSAGERLAWTAYGCLVAPLVEELVYRGMLYRVMRNSWGVWPAAVVSSLMFAFMHAYSAVGTVDTFVYGMLFCLLYQRTGSIAIAAMGHASINTIIFGSAWLMGW